MRHRGACDEDVQAVILPNGSASANRCSGRWRRRPAKPLLWEALFFWFGRILAERRRPVEHRHYCLLASGLVAPRRSCCCSRIEVRASARVFSGPREKRSRLSTALPEEVPEAALWGAAGQPAPGPFSSGGLPDHRAARPGPRPSPPPDARALSSLRSSGTSRLPSRWIGQGSRTVGNRFQPFPSAQVDDDLRGTHREQREPERRSLVMASTASAASASVVVDGDPRPKAPPPVVAQEDVASGRA